MVDPFLDPLDTSPIKLKIYPVPQSGGLSPSQGANTSNFDRLLAKQIKGEPTPILRPENLQTPDLPSVPVQLIPKELAIIHQEKHQPTPVPELKDTNPTPVSLPPLSEELQNEPKPANLSELLLRGTGLIFSLSLHL